MQAISNRRRSRASLFMPPGRHPRRDMRTILPVVLTLLLLPGITLARGVYQAPEAFIDTAFAGHPPERAAIWLDSELKQRLARQTGQSFRQLRIPYWLEGQRSAWILEAIGKEEPITLGVVVNDGRIEKIKVLIYRESRGWEVRHDFFTEQFIGASLGETTRLDRSIDGISGATLSVRAVTQLTETALLLHDHVTRKP